MPEFTLGYREVIPDQTIQESWKEITLTTGGTQSTLQDIKVAEKANGYCYQDSTEHYTRNRFIYWRINYDILELVEHSLDVNLSGNRVRYKFTDTPILDGISAYETDENVIVLVPTVCSAHRLIFPHPRRFHRQDSLLGSHPDLAAPSIFSKALASDARDPNTFVVISSPSTASDQLPNQASSFLCPETGEAIYVFAYPSGELLLIKQNIEGLSAATELKGESLMPRFLSGLAEKFRQKNADGNIIVATLIQIVNEEIYAVTLSRDGHIKFWSCSKGQCVAVIDILAENGDATRNKVQGGILKKCIDCDTHDEEDSTFAVYMKFTYGGQFHILKPVISGQNIKIVTVSTLTSMEEDLVDFALQKNRIWSSYRCEDGDCVIYTARLNSSNWIPIIRESVPESEIACDGEGDPKQIYLQHIFYPGRFPLNILSKALSIYKRSAVLADTVLSAAALKQSICVAVEQEIQNMFKENMNKENVVNDADYIAYAEWCWQKFYDCCVEYNVASLKLLGIMLLPSVSGAVLLKKSTFSFIRPMESLEHMTLCSQFMDKKQFVNFALVGEGDDTVEDIMTLFEVIVYLDQELSTEFSSEFEKQLTITFNPSEIMLNLINKIKDEMGYREFLAITSQVSNMLSLCTDLYNAVRKLLGMLKQDTTLADPDNSISPPLMSYFSSALGVSFVANCLMQQTQIRFSICRNLLLICHVLLEHTGQDLTTFKTVHSICTPDVETLILSNYVMSWLGSVPALINLPQDSTLQRLNPIKLAPVYNLRQNNAYISLLELFSASSGGHRARKSFSRIRCSTHSLAHWHLSLLNYLNHLRQIICPLKNNANLAEWLLSSGQNLRLEQYVQLLADWCPIDVSSCKFLLAASFLTTGENFKALDLFQTAQEGVFKDQYLQEKVLRGQHVDQPRLAYYLKVIQLFELHKARDCAISIAHAALSIVDTDHPLCATLYSIKFKHHLGLKHYTEAFYALKSNPDADRQKDNLRDLVKTLLDERKFDVLLNFTYGSLDEFFTNIILTRARATDATNNVYYDFLYAYQIKRGPMCFRLAASVMYEQAFRLSHINTAESLEKQVKSYLASKNALQLCDPEFAWVVCPSDPDDSENDVVLEKGNEMRVVRLKKQVDVVNIDVIMKELLFASAKLKLARFDAASPSTVTTPIELMTLLNNAGLFKTALDICKVFDIPYNSVFETLTRHCVMLSEEDIPSAWNWLVENDLQDLPANRESAAEVVWRLLEEHLEKYEEPNMTVLHKVVCKKIISMRVYIPYWLLASYKLRNPSELIKLLHSTGRLDEAYEIAKEYLLAALGYGKELFGFTQPLVPTNRPFCMPVYSIQCLITELKLQNEKSSAVPFVKEWEILKGLFDKYLQTATRMSNEKCQMEMSTMGSIKVL